MEGTKSKSDIASNIDLFEDVVEILKERNKKRSHRGKRKPYTTKKPGLVQAF